MSINSEHYWNLMISIGQLLKSMLRDKNALIRHQMILLTKKLLRGFTRNFFKEI